MPLFDELRKNPHQHFVTSDPSLEGVLKLIESFQEQLKALPGKDVMDLMDTFIQPLLEFEKQSEATKNPWRFTLDMPSEEGKYTKPPVFQLCSGSPHYQRFVVTFDADGMTPTLNVNCVEEKPDLSQIKGPDSTPLTHTKDFYDFFKVQRLAVLGSARVFAHAKDPKNPTSSNLWAQKYTTHIQLQMNKLLDEISTDSPGGALLVNGGWAGQKEGSTGVPLMSHIFGTMLNAERVENYSPVTVMPSCGIHDRVPTPQEGMFFEVPGQWGDDSKYLVGLSTALIVFEPYGYWTNIEIANGLAQDKPVVIIADPELVDNAQVGEEYHALKDESAEYIEKPFKLPNGTQSNYRVYKDAGAAAKWINSISLKQLDQDRAKLVAGIQEVSTTSSTTSVMKGLGASAGGKTPVMKGLGASAGGKAPVMDELEEFFSLELTLATSEPVEDEHEVQKRAEGGANEGIEDDEKVLPRPHG